MSKRWFFLCYLWMHGYFLLPLFSLSPSDLSLEEKVGQVLMVHFHGQEANDEAKHLIQDVHVGGIIYYQWANELSHPQQVQLLSQGLQNLAQKNVHPIPLLIAVDQEGGRVCRLKQGFTVFPGNYALGQTGEWQWGEECAWMIGQELKAVGISLNLAPVVDVYTQPANPVIGMRAFSSDPAQVAYWGKLTLRGYKKAGIIAALKHFPGHGDVQVDSHEALPIVNKNREALEQVEFLPFRLLAPEADVILTAHLLIPALDEKQCVTFSQKIISDFLRKELNFQGVIMSDSLAMQGILSQCSSLEEAALKSLQAGHDFILLGGKQLLTSQNGLESTAETVKRIHYFLVNAVKQGKLSEQRLDESVARILALKQKYGLFDFVSLVPEILKEQVGTDSHRAHAQRIARHALSVIHGQDLLPLSFDPSLLIVAPHCLREEIEQTDWQWLGPHTQILYFKGLNPDWATIQAIKLEAKKSKQCLYFAYHAWQFPGQQELFQQIVKTSAYPLAITVDPFDADLLQSAAVGLCTYSPVACSLQAAFDCLTGKELKISKQNIELTSREESD